MKVTLTISLFFLCSYLCGQISIPKNFAGLHFGGQALVGYSYDRTLIHKQFFKLNGATGLVINEYADDTDPSDRPIIGLNIGIIGLYDIQLKYLFVESGIYYSPYFYKSLTFINCYAWLGLRVNSKSSNGGFASLGWTPSLFFIKNSPEGYNNVKVGVKLGFNF